MAARILRVLALAIAIAGIIDPAMSRSTQVTADIALVAAPRLPDPGLLDRVASALGSQFTVIRGPSLSPAATVNVGYQLLAPIDDERSKAFGVVPAASTPAVWIAGATAPSVVHVRGDVPVTARFQAIGGRGRTAVVSIANGTGIVDRVTRAIESDDESAVVTLTAVASAAGRQTLRMTASIEGEPTADTLDLSLTVGDGLWTVLAFDPRPSWTATFVRRVLESDPRFTVTSRVGTSRGTATSAGAPPVSLSVAGSLSAFDVVVVGAAQEISDADARGLEQYMRDGGGAVILLLDDVRDSPALRSLTHVAAWTESERAEPAGEPLARHWLLPRDFPAWAESDTDAHGPSAATPPALWSTSFGSGRLVVSGALDAWRYRGDSRGEFDRFWERTISEVAEGTEEAERRKTEGAEEVGSMSRDDDRELIRQWASSRGGVAIGEAELSSLAGTIAGAVQPATETRVFHPMRSAWWMLPFGLALGAEWWLRRRSGQR